MQTHLADPNRLALGIRQPWAELILRGIKTIEVRSLDTQVRGPIYVYASKKLSDHPAAEAAIEQFRLDIDSLPRGVVVGTVDLHETAPATPADAVAACLPAPALEGRWCWHLQQAERFAEPLAVRFLPYGVWFYPWKRKSK